MYAEAESEIIRREKQIEAENMRVLERLVMLRIIDTLWVEHLTTMEAMRLQAGWEAVRERRSIDSYKREGYQQFQTLLREKGVYDEKAFLKFNVFMNLVRLAAVYASIPFWTALGLL